jgi:hypothetical protein
MDIEVIKRKLRELRRLEIKLRSGGDNRKLPGLAWETFFNLHSNMPQKAKYSLAELAALNHDEFRHLVHEYWAFVYDDLFSENVLAGSGDFDIKLLARLGLPVDADAAAVKRRFRELAKRYHPDLGGDAASFIELIELYRQLSRSRTPECNVGDGQVRPQA